MNRTPAADGARLYFQQQMDAPNLVSAAAGTAVVFSTRCPGKATPNEDAAAVIPVGENGAVFVVADGVGGAAVGEVASRRTVELLRAAIDEVEQAGNLVRTGIINGIERANEAVQGLGGGAATTVAVVELVDGKVRPYHVGDSAILVMGGRGKLKLWTVAHSPVGYAIEAGMLDEAEALHHEDRHLVSNVIGSPEMHIQIGPAIQLARRDTVLVASDGLFDNLRVEEIVGDLKGGSLEKKIQSLIDRAQSRMQRSENEQPSKPDDLTLIAFRSK